MCLYATKKPVVAKKELTFYKVLCDWVEHAHPEITDKYDNWPKDPSQYKKVLMSPYQNMDVEIGTEYKITECDHIQVHATKIDEGVLGNVVTHGAFHLFASLEDAKRFVEDTGAGFISWYNKSLIIVKAIVPEGAEYVEGIMPELGPPWAEKRGDYNCVAVNRVRYELLDNKLPCPSKSLVKC